MARHARDRPLAGLVSDEAEQLYARLLEAGSLEIGPGPDQVDTDSAPARELTDARIAYRSHIHADRVLPVAHPIALQLLLSQRHVEITTRQQRVLDGWELLDSILSTRIEETAAKSPRDDPLVEVVTGLETVSHVSHELYQSAKHELLGLTTGRFARPIEQQTVLTPPAPAMDRGGQFRMIYDADFAADLAGLRMIEASVESGENARIRAHLPMKMLHVDDSVALVALTGTGVDGSLLVRSPTLLAALREWFEFLWNDDATTAVDGVVADELNAPQRQVLRLLSSGLSDDAIARASDVSVRTVRRHITAILEQLGVNSRFAAGAMAAKRGWI